MITDYGRDWWRDKRQVGRIAKEFNPAYFDMGEAEEVLEGEELKKEM